MEDNRFYVYVHRRKDTGDVFYVGSGAAGRFKLKSNRSVGWNEIATTVGFTSEIIIENLTEKQARNIEKDFILHYGDSIVNKQIPPDVITLTKEYLDALYYYDDTSTTFLRHKLNTGARNPKHKRYVGDEAGYFEYRNAQKHRVRIGIPTGENVAVHRIIYIMHYGSIPDGEVIDHIDGNPFNNCISNLRSVSKEINAKNLKLSKANTSGVKGIQIRKLGKYDVIVATWRENNKCRSKAFYVCKYGYEEALRLATETRMNKLAEMQGFTDRGHFKE